ncbi:sulfatase-like hydrolase/transferase [bacterium]|nr:sulfatase-like hydrolase/transferase [bacterium]
MLRVALLIRYADLTADIPTSIVLKSFLVGLRFDLAVTSYILAPVALFAFLPRIGMIPSKLNRRISTVYLIIMAGIAFLMEIVDLEFYGQFSMRLNRLPLEYTQLPSMMFKMIWEMFPVVKFLLAWLVLTALFGFLLHKITRFTYNRPATELRLAHFAIIYPLVLGLVFLGIRGRVAIKSPLTWSIAFFSPHHFTNQLALNSCFTFVQDALVESSRRNKDAEPFAGISPKDAYAKTRELLRIDPDKLVEGHPIARYEGSDSLNPSAVNNQPHNVMLILMESLAAEYVGCTGGSRSLAPEFDKMSEEGLLFTRFYSTSGHTSPAIFSSSCGLPIIPGVKNLMKRAEGQRPLSGIGLVLKERGYNTLFYVPHDLHFDNIKGFLTVNGFDRLTGQHSYPAKEVLSSLGVADEVMFDRILDDLTGVQEPFLTMVMTASNHGPFIVPERPHIHPDPSVEPQHKRFNAFRYADWALGRFYEGLKQTEWGKRTLLIIIGDHGIIKDQSRDIDLALYRVPMLIIDAELIEPGVSDHIGCQMDVTATIMDILGGSWINNTYGVSLLNDKPGHALFIREEAVGFIHNDYYLLKGFDGNFSLFRLEDPDHKIKNNELSIKMNDYSEAMFSSFYFLIKSRLAGLP